MSNVIDISKVRLSGSEKVAELILAALISREENLKLNGKQQSSEAVLTALLWVADLYAERLADMDQHEQVAVRAGDYWLTLSRLTTEAKELEYSSK